MYPVARKQNYSSKLNKTENQYKSDLISVPVVHSFSIDFIKVSSFNIKHQSLYIFNCTIVQIKNNLKLHSLHSISLYLSVNV